MVIRNKYKDSTTQTEHVRFVSYSGRYPNLCSGELVLEVDGVEHRFHYRFGTCEDETHHKDFWSSGGYLDEEYCAVQGEWDIIESELPEPMRKYAEEIDFLFNENVPQGCCGGCS